MVTRSLRSRTAWRQSSLPISECRKCRKLRGGCCQRI
jgi:hypothetical protein